MVDGLLVAVKTFLFSAFSQPRLTVESRKFGDQALMKSIHASPHITENR